MKSRQGSINQYFKPTSKDIAIASVQNPVKSSPDVIRVEINQHIVTKNPVGRPIKRKQSFLIETDDDGLTEEQVREVKEREDMEANDDFAIQKAKTTSYNSWSDAMKLSLKFHCHIYGKNLKHIGWQTGEYVIDKVKELFPGASEKTIRNKITLEHKGEPDGDIKSLLHELRAILGVSILVGNLEHG
jgi:type III secretory pathway component EscV